MTTTPQTFDLIVIGGGPVGENIAQYATEHSDLTAALVDRELFGGECSYYACMPSKALLRPIEVARATHRLGGVSDAHLEPSELMRRRDEWVSHYDDSGQVDWARDAGLTVVRGRARIVGPRRVSVECDGEQHLLEARRHVVIATGSAPIVPDLYADALPWGSRDATAIQEVPARLIVVGGGVVACEAATWLAAMGSAVTLVVRGDRLLTRAEPFAAECVAAALAEAGVHVRFGAQVTNVQRDAPAETGLGRVHGGAVTATIDGEPLEADEILVAVGRAPALEGLGLETVGVEASAVTSGELPDWLIAVGDASGEAPLTHWGKYRARVLGAQIAARAQGRSPEPVPPHVPVPQVVFTTPQVASVGLTEAQAREAGHDVVTSCAPWSSAAGAALLEDGGQGQAKLVVDRVSHQVLGATFVGPDTAELVHAASVAIVGGVPTQVLRHAVPSYPTASELWLRLLEDLPTEFRWAPSGE